ncbi:MAG: hypothetical protein ABIH85_04650 [Candidatus Omnitrophota bacterium]|nr:hypothetical protein [Candidatus Omnitrophota bacterium]MBU1895209.1 hypothetical protein [Candidatus Omnitrophota bacterium]
MKKTDVHKLIKKYKPVIKKTGKQLAEVAKTAEEDISKIYKIAHTYVEMQMKNLQKEKLFHEIGKDVAQRMLSGKINVPELEKYKPRLILIDSAGSKMKKKLTRIGKMNKSKKASKKNK